LEAIFLLSCASVSFPFHDTPGTLGDIFVGFISLNLRGFMKKTPSFLFRSFFFPPTTTFVTVDSESPSSYFPCPREENFSVYKKTGCSLFSDKELLTQLQALFFSFLMR